MSFKGNWDVEGPKIEAACAKRGVDPAFVKAIRKAENGSEGVEFGVLSTAAPNYDSQLQICVNTVAHRLTTYTLNPIERDAFQRLRYREAWIGYFASIWAPVREADNDPNHLNKNWYANVVQFYKEFRGE